ncbi:hypothetical protein [Actinoplanes solisilvae]|uniref:hypothetical protein n=1 Tax=Actinoplanes solisilvae TaxID=2486853 RepID=UPI000FDAF1FF|nr:hypothetical protein [Actinoplanes solisilvae]
MSDGGLDDLFGGREDLPVADEPAPEQRKRSWLGWVLRNLLLIAVTTAVIVAALRSADVEISVLFVVAALAGLRLVLLAVAEVRSPPAPKRSDRRRSDNTAGTDSMRAAVRRWERDLERAQADDDLYSRNVLPVLAELTDERLRLRHGITRASDPRRARELLGDKLWAVLADGRRLPRARDLESYVDVLERL